MKTIIKKINTELKHVSKYKIYFVILNILILLFSIYFILFVGYENAIKNFKEFDSKTLIGKVYVIEMLKGGVQLNITNDSKSYYFKPYKDYINYNLDFNSNNFLNDTIFKPAFSDTLFVKSNKYGKILKYNFKIKTK